MQYIRMEHARDEAIPHLLSVYRLPDVSRFIHIKEETYWDYVTSGDHIFYFKVYRDETLVAAIHCERSEDTLFLDIVVFPQYQRQGIGSEILRDIQENRVLSGFARIEVSIDESNRASVGLFEKMGFTPMSKEDELILYEYKSR